MPTDPSGDARPPLASQTSATRHSTSHSSADVPPARASKRKRTSYDATHATSPHQCMSLGGAVGSTTPLFLKRPHSLERHLHLSRFEQERASTACTKLKQKLDEAAAMYRLAHSAMTLQSKVAGGPARDRLKSMEVRTVDTFKASALGMLRATPQPPRPWRSSPIPVRSPFPRTSNGDTHPETPAKPTCQDPYFYLRPLQLHSLDHYDAHELKKVVLSPQDNRTLHDCIAKWVLALLDSSAYPSSPETLIDMSRAALVVQHIALAAHYLGSHAYASTLLASKYGTTVSPFLSRIQGDSIPLAHAGLSKPLWPFGRALKAAFPDVKSLVKATRKGCPEAIGELLLSTDAAHAPVYDKASDEAAYLQQCMWMAKLTEFVPGQLHLVTNGIKAIARSILALHRRQVMHRWRQVMPTPAWRAFAATHGAGISPTVGYLRQVLTPPPSVNPTASREVDPTTHRSKWLQKYASSFRLQDAVQHLMDPATIARMYRHGEKLQLGHYVLLDEEVNPTGADDMMDQLHATRQDLAKYDRALTWHVWATTHVLADPTSSVFTEPKHVEERTRPSLATSAREPSSPSLDSIQSQLQQLATQLQHTKQHQEASKWIGRAIEQLSHHPLHQNHSADNGVVGQAAKNDGGSEEESTVAVDRAPPAVPPAADNFVDLTEDDDPSEELVNSSGNHSTNAPPAAASSPRYQPRSDLGEPSSPSAVSAPVVSDQRMYLTCPVLDRRIVRQMGALFDLDVKEWYVPPGLNLTLFSRWSPQRRAVESLPEPTSPPSSPPRLSTECMYFDCPYIERDQARSLGALWDSEKKLWVVPAGRDLKPFIRWTPRAPQVSANREYLECPYPQKFLVKGLGAEWDPDANAWFVPPGLDLARFTRWLPQPTETPVPSVENVTPVPAPAPPAPAPSSPREDVAVPELVASCPPPTVAAPTPSTEDAAPKPPTDGVAPTPTVSSAAPPAASPRAPPAAPPARKIPLMPLKRRAISQAAILSSCSRVLVDIVDTIEKNSGCQRCKYVHLWTCVRCVMCKAHCTCWEARRAQQNLRSEQETIFEAARRRARLLKQVTGQSGPLPDYTTCVTGSELVSTTRILAMWRDTNMFGVLGVPPTANFSVVKRQYRSMVLQLHPDKSKHDTPDKVSAFMAVTKAFRAVKDQFGVA